MASSIEDFVKKITRINRKFTFIFTEDFFALETKTGNAVDRYLKVRNMIRNVGYRKGEKHLVTASDESLLFDVDVVVVHNYGCYATNFKELSKGPYSAEAMICGFGTEMVDAQKAKYLVESFFAEKKEHHSEMISTMLKNQRGRQVILIAESLSDLKRPILEPIRNLRSRLETIFVNSTKGPIVDCQVMSIYQEGNSNTLSSLLTHFCINY